MSTLLLANPPRQRAQEGVFFPDQTGRHRGICGMRYHDQAEAEGQQDRDKALPGMDC